MLRTMAREVMRELDPEDRVVNFDEVQIGLHEKQALKEAGRCLACGCSAAFTCSLREMMNEHEVESCEQSAKRIHYQRVAAVDTHPVISVDPNKCIRCERCREACATLQVSNAVELSDWAQLNDRCVQCGLCVDLCPTGALMEKREGRPVERLAWERVKSHCIHCGCGCGIELMFKGRKLRWIQGGSYEAPNRASSCRRGRFHTFDPIWFGDRVLRPLIRKGGALDAVSWPKAISSLIAGFACAGEHYTPMNIGVIASPRAGCEALYLMQKWLRMAMKSHGLDFPGREATERLWASLKEITGYSGMSHDLAGLERAEAIFVFGEGIEDLSPVVAARIRRAVVTRKAPLWQISSQADTLTPYASIQMHMPLEMQCTLLDELAAGGRMEGASFGLVKEALSRAASVAFVIPESLFESEMSARAARSFVRLASSHVRQRGGQGAGLYPLTREINSCGALLMGISPAYLPGFVNVSDESARRKLMEVWYQAELSDTVFIGVEEALEAGLIRALLVQDAARLRKKEPKRWDRLLEQVEFLALLETIPSPAMEYAQVVLPVAGYTEQAGTVLSQELRLLRLARAVEPRGESLPDWEIMSRILAAHGLPYPRDMSAIHQEIQAVLSEMAGLFLASDFMAITSAIFRASCEAPLS